LPFPALKAQEFSLARVHQKLSWEILEISTSTLKITDSMGQKMKQKFGDLEFLWLDHKAQLDLVVAVLVDLPAHREKPAQLEHKVRPE
jgi:hypothetical protein